jgi:hypothetical protein
MTRANPISVGLAIQVRTQATPRLSPAVQLSRPIATCNSNHWRETVPELTIVVEPFWTRSSNSHSVTDALRHLDTC